jgi:hypothetical protein
VKFLKTKVPCICTLHRLFYHIFFQYPSSFTLYHCIYGFMLCMVVFNFANHVFMFLCYTARSESRYEIIKVLEVMSTSVYTDMNPFNYTEFANTFSRSAFEKSLCADKRCWKWYPKTIVSKNWIKQLHTLPVLHFNRCLTVKLQHTATATSTLTAKSTYRSLSAQRLSERAVYS